MNDPPVIPRKETGKKLIRRSSPQKQKVTNDPPVTPRKEAGKKLTYEATYESEVKLVDVETPSNTDKLSSKKIEKSKRMRNKNINFLTTFIQKNYETIQNTDDHDFFKKMKYNQSLFDGLNKDFFAPGGNKKYSEDANFIYHMQKITKASQDFITKAIKNSKSKILVFKSSRCNGITSEEIESKEIITLHNADDNFWLNTKVFDAYLQNIVVPDMFPENSVSTTLSMSMTTSCVLWLTTEIQTMPTSHTPTG